MANEPMSDERLQDYSRRCGYPDHEGSGMSVEHLFYPGEVVQLLDEIKRLRAELYLLKGQ